MLDFLYNSVLTLVFLVGLFLIPMLSLFGRRFRGGLLERFGFYGRSVRDALAGARPLWLHAASVGEVVAAKELIAACKARFPERKILLSTFTTTGRDVARQSAGADACVLLPLDHPWIVRRSLACLNPAMLVLLETELWPNLLRLCYDRGVPTVLLSGRLSARSFRRYFLLRRFFSRVVSRLTAVGMQSAEDAERIKRLGADPRRVAITGNLKRAAQAHPPEGRISGRELGCKMDSGAAVLVAGSTHDGEDEIIVEAFRDLKKSFPALVLVLAPRHPQRFADVERFLKASGLRYIKRTEMNGEPIADILFLDTLGELADFYSIADLAFVGGSLVAAGGHNVLEPARCRKPVFFGPYTANFFHIVQELKLSGGGIEVAGKNDLVRQAARLLGDPVEAKRVGERAYGVAQADRKVVEGSMELVARYF
ncbi:MAG TPA: 3-deoxy-D-manno-octulosonic acid transferase [Verrucomicrobiae bacterium]|jgi:3-deoxy-D-manno-octulosonic-acid transferase|nr:3-deoxy-D-manno-octulosonic acid transferase [Verrucomicrobiae bacterium]